MPGPGDYEIQSTMKVKSKPLYIQSFDSMVPRFKSSAKESELGPGSYDEFSQSFQIKRKLFN